MYQFYYANDIQLNREEIHDDVRHHLHIVGIRPTMWEEHCLECSAPACYGTCAHFKARTDGRCQRFEDGYHIFDDERACNGQGARVSFRKWANMMTIVFPPLLHVSTYKEMFEKNEVLGKHLHHITQGKLPVFMKWNYIRVREYLRRRGLRKSAEGEKPNAFVLHVYSYHQSDFHLIMEIYDDHTSIYKKSFLLTPGENLYILNKEDLSDACFTSGHLVKIYPENDIEATLDIYWCDFVKGTPVGSNNQPAAKVKCVVWDLDNTVWDGILIETEDSRKLQIKDGVLDTIKALDERGIIQSIASKNDYDEAWTVIESLGLSDYFLYPQIHWHAKSESMRNIAKSLNIGLDTLCLIDDSVYEREQVHQTLQQVRVYDPAELDSLLSLPEFDVLVTEDSKNRRLMYQAEEHRQQLQSNANLDAVDFLRQCHITVKLFIPTTDEELTRCYELLIRTNQLNMSGIKYTREEFDKILHLRNRVTYALSCSDDFGSYGIVGFLQYEVHNNELHMCEYAMSCRVAGKFVESVVFSSLLDLEKCAKGHMTVNITNKNRLLRNTLDSIGFKSEQQNKKIKYCFDRNLKHKDIVQIEIEVPK